MRRTTLLRIAALAALLVGVGIVAALLGQWYGQKRAEAARAENREQLDQYLHSTLQSIGTGYPFPDIAVWPADGGAPLTVRTLLPNGGLLLFFASECESCADAIRAFGEVWVSSRYQSTPIVLVTGGHSDALLHPLRESGCNVMLYRDIEDVLRQQYQLSLARVFFAINNDGIVAGMGPVGEDVRYFAILLKQYAKGEGASGQDRRSR